MILANIKAGLYYIIDGMKVVAYIRRAYKPAPVGRGFWSDGYSVQVADTGEITKFKTLSAIHEKYKFENYPGYGHVLK